jgi:hypothetical protein
MFGPEQDLEVILMIAVADLMFKGEVAQEIWVDHEII